MKFQVLGDNMFFFFFSKFMLGIGIGYIVNNS